MSAKQIQEDICSWAGQMKALEPSPMKERVAVMMNTRGHTMA